MFGTKLSPEKFINAFLKELTGDQKDLLERSVAQSPQRNHRHTMVDSKKTLKLNKYSFTAQERAEIEQKRLNRRLRGEYLTNDELAQKALSERGKKSGQATRTTLRRDPRK